DSQCQGWVDTMREGAWRAAGRPAPRLAVPRSRRPARVGATSAVVRPSSVVAQQPSVGMRAVGIPGSAGVYWPGIHGAYAPVASTMRAAVASAAPTLTTTHAASVSWSQQG